MADFGQGDEVVSKPKSSWGHDDEVVSTKQASVETKQSIGGPVSNLARTTTESVLPGLGGLAGAAAGASAVTPLAEGVLAVGGPAGPIIAGALELGGAGLGAYLGAEGVASVQDKLHQLIAPEDFEQRKLQRKQNPATTFVGNIAGGVVGLSPKVAVDTTAKVINTAMKARAASAAAQAGVSAGTQLATTGTVDPLEMGVAAVTGAVLPGTNRLGTPFAGVGKAIGETVANVFKPGKPTTKTKPFDLPDRPLETATPEEKTEYIKKLEAIKTERDSKAPLVEAAIRNKETGEIERMGPKHDQARKDDIRENPNYEEGFIDERGNFHERTAAVDQAKRSGQIPEDHVLENPPGETPGLHSGDLRKAGDKRFEITDEQPVGEPKPPVEEGPKTREEHKKAIDDLEYDIFVTHEIDLQEAKKMGDTDGVAEIESRIKRDQEKLEQLSKDIPPVQFDNPLKPTWEELHDHLWNANKVGEAFDKILNADIGSKGQQFLIKALNQSQFIRDAKLEFSKEFLKYIDKDGFEKQDAVGLYTGNSIHKVELGKEGSLTTLLHEAIHAGTQKLLTQGNHPAAIKLQKLFEEFEEKYNADYKKEMELYKENKPNATPAELKDYEQFYHEQNKPYGLTDVDEFIAEAFTNKDFQKLLGSIKSKEPNTVIGDMWESFKDTVRKGLNIPESQRTAFDDAIEHGTKLIEESKSYSALNVFSVRTSPSVVKAAEKIDPRSIPNEKEFYEHATDIYERYGEEVAIKFFEDYNKNLKEQSIPVPNNMEELDDAFHKLNTFQTKDRSENVSWYKENTENGVTAEDRTKWFDMRERGEELPPEAKAVLDVIDQENLALVRKIKAMGGDVGDEFVKGQSRIRIFGDVQSNWLNTIKEFFSNGGALGDKIADQANAAMERKVFGLETWTTDPKVEGAAVKKETGRVIEMHRHLEDTTYSYQDGSGKWQTVPVKKGTSIWEWKDGKRKQIGHSEKLDLKRGDTLELKVPGEAPVGADGTKVTRVIKSQAVISDGKVMDIERHSPYRYLHDAEASARLANIGLRKQARELEFINNLKQSKLFEEVGFSPDKPLKNLPQGWKVPNSIDRIPELRGWHFDPKTAAIIEDFAKVWDNTMWTKLSNALVKNMMLNPVPHMFNEVMHLWNARGFTGWVDPRRLGTFADTARQAARDVGSQTKFYRDIMREGGSILGADPRNKEFFEPIFENAKKEMFGDKNTQRNLGQLAKRLGTTVGDLYNGISKASNKAMWFTRDVMYVQYVREIMAESQKRGQPMDLKSAIKEAEKHMPNYRLPSEVLGKRGLSQVLRNPNISMFSRYHYGMVKSLVNTIKDVDPRNLSSPEGRKHFRQGVDSMLAIGVAMGVLYPLMDYIAESMFGEGAEQRRAGPFHLLQAGVNVATNKKDASALIWPVFTFNPVLLSLGQLAFNKNIFTGKKVYHPDDPLGDVLGDIGQYIAKQVPMGAPMISAVTDEDAETQFAAKQLDIKVKTEAEKQRESKAIERERRAAKSRVTKRDKRTYIP